eukprot:14788983-Alexandrium_andersonii.AAC.1
MRADSSPADLGLQGRDLGSLGVEARRDGLLVLGEQLSRNPPAGHQHLLLVGLKPPGDIAR